MPTIKNFLKLSPSSDVRKTFYSMYDEKYFNLFLNSFTWTGISREQREYIMRRFWADGKVAAFSIIKPDSSFALQKPDDYAVGLIGFAPFAENNWNMYNYPTSGILINERGVPYIPNKNMINGKDVVLMYATHSRQPIRGVIDVYLDKLADIEMTIRTNLIASKIPVVYEVGPDSETHAKDLQSAILNDDPSFFTAVGEVDTIKAANSGVPYIIDKLFGYKVEVENELLSFLGIDNVSIEKNERLTQKEATSHDELIFNYKNIVSSCFEEDCKMIKDVLGFDISAKRIEMPKPIENEENKGVIKNGTNN